MAANALLVRWFYGWSEVRDDAAIAANGRREALLGIGAAHSREEMVRVAQSQLAIFADTRTEISADVVPVDETDTPYLGFNIGDTITVPGMDGTPTAERVMAVTVSEDDNGYLTYAPEIKDVILGRQERQAQTIKKMADGTLDGASKPAQPVATFTNREPTCCSPTPPEGGGA